MTVRVRSVFWYNIAEGIRRKDIRKMLTVS